MHLIRNKYIYYGSYVKPCGKRGPSAAGIGAEGWPTIGIIFSGCNRLSATVEIAVLGLRAS